MDIGVWIKDWLARKSPITMNSWGGITDPDLGLYIHFHGQPNGRDFRRLGSPEVDRLLDEGRTERDPARRVRIYHDLQRLLATEAISLPLYSADLVFAHQRHVKGLSIHPTGYFYGLRGTWVER